MTRTYEGQLEIDAERGVIYFHSAATGVTLLRICGVPKPIPLPDENNLLDITLYMAAAYRGLIRTWLTSWVGNK